MVAKVEASADRATSTRHAETTVAVTTRGAEADCPCANACAAAKMTATRTSRIKTRRLEPATLTGEEPHGDHAVEDPLTLLVEVQDNGIGIAADKLESIF
jgi:signal transduction histidine kinase